MDSIDLGISYLSLLTKISLMLRSWNRSIRYSDVFSLGEYFSEGLAEGKRVGVAFNFDRSDSLGVSAGIGQLFDLFGEFFLDRVDLYLFGGDDNGHFLVFCFSLFWFYLHFFINQQKASLLYQLKILKQITAKTITLT